MIKKTIIYMIAIFLISRFLPGVVIKDWVSLLVFVLVLGLLNAFVKPVLTFLAMPLIWLTLGVFTFFLNALLFYFASALIDGVRVDNFWTALVASLLLSLLVSIIEFLLR